MNRGTLALALAFCAGVLACSSGTGNNGTGNTGGLVGSGGLVDTGGALDTGGVLGTGGIVGAGGGGSQATSCGTCPAGLVCERYPPATCADPNWDQWPLPNSQVDVAASAPNPESYTDNGDGTVTDNVTGIMWQQAVPASRYSWADAVAYCPTLPLAGHSDWRLPSIIELLSIVDYGHPISINPTYFPSTVASGFSEFWSSSPVAGSPSYAWYVDFTGGGSSYFDNFMSYPVRCVR